MARTDSSGAAPDAPEADVLNFRNGWTADLRLERDWEGERLIAIPLNGPTCADAARPFR